MKPISDRQRAKILRDIQAGRSQGQAAKRAGVAPSTVSRLVSASRAAVDPGPPRVSDRPFDARRVSLKEIRSTAPLLTDPPDPVEDFEIPATEASDDILVKETGPVAGLADTSDERTKRPIVVLPEQPGQFPLRDPWPPTELSFAGQAALLRTSHRPEPTHPPCYVDGRGGHHHRLMVIFGGGR